MDMVPVILAGGGGSRLWPLSREETPKQFLSLIDEHSLLHATILRMKGFVALDRVKVVCGSAHRVPVLRELEGLGLSGETALIHEPHPRNTGPAVLLAARVLADDGADPILIILPSDHAIGDIPAFHACMDMAVAAARAGSIATLGVAPDRPETGFGYIEIESPLVETEIRPVKQFVEKPDEETATAYLASGRHLWNTGIFVFRASVMIEEFKRYQPEISRGIEAHLAGEADAFPAIPNLSLDYAVMEYTQKAVVIPADFAWSDLGTWRSVHENGPKDLSGNAQHGQVRLNHCRDSYFRAEHRLVIGLGVSDLVVVETEDAVLIVDKDQCQDVKKVVMDAGDRLGNAEKEASVLHRPWGTITILSQDVDHKTKKLDILPGKRLSLQYHNFRTEYWVVVRGRARVTREGEVFDMAPGDTTTIPAQAKHRIENIGPDLLSLIEVQLGSYFGEDDIVRFEDDYGRSSPHAEASLLKTE